MKKEEQTMNEEILAKLKEAKSAEEILAIAKEDGKEVTAEQARELYDRLHGGGELSDDDLAKVAGGGFHRIIDSPFDAKRIEYTVTIPY